VTLADRLRARIAREGPLRFDAYMEAALFDPEDGYYARGPAIGRAGDFATATNEPAFARCLARFARDVRARLGDPPGFRVIDAGGGTGALASALAAEGFAVGVVERAPGLAAAQRARGLDTRPAIGDFAPITGVVVANELLDAFPARRVEATAEGFVELGVGLDAAGRFVEVPLGPADAALAALVGDLPSGCRAEASPAALAWIADLSSALTRGVAIVLDYGGAAHEIRGEHLPRGTLRAYRQHAIVDPLADPGSADLTADVDFDAVAEAGRRAGFAVAGPVNQGSFLLGNGLVDEMEAARVSGDLEGLFAMRTLALPGGMGERFKVAGLARGMRAEGLSGFERPRPGPQRS